MGTVVGSLVGRVFQLSPNRIVIEFTGEFTRFLLADIALGRQAVYIAGLRLRDLKRAALHPAPFTQHLLKHLSGLSLVEAYRMPDDRVLKLAFTSGRHSKDRPTHVLAIQLTGRSSNLFLLDENQMILSRQRETHGQGQELGDIFSPPSLPDGISGRSVAPIDRLVADSPSSPSEIIGRYLSGIDADEAFQAIAREAMSKLRNDRKKTHKRITNLRKDLSSHGDAETLKRNADLLLANLYTAKIVGTKAFVVDHFDPAMAEVEVEIDEGESLHRAAERYYKRSAKARRSLIAITERIKFLETELESLDLKIGEAEKAIIDRDEETLATYLGRPVRPHSNRAGQKSDPISTIARRFFSSDGFEIHVGKRARDNDALTFKLARSLDLWLHAADYPGSHVIVRNPNRVEIPERTLIEAAKLAAFYSQAASQPKAAVRYTERKFVSKPKGSAAGLVRISKFKTILVEPEKPDLDVNRPG